MPSVDLFGILAVQTHQPDGVTKGAPPTVENKARTVRAVTAIATVPIAASDIAIRTCARPHDRESSSRDPITSTASNAVAVRSPNPIFSVWLAEGPTSNPTVRVTMYAAIVRMLTRTPVQYSKREGATMTTSAHTSSKTPMPTKNAPYSQYSPKCCSITAKWTSAAST